LNKEKADVESKKEKARESIAQYNAQKSQDQATSNEVTVRRAQDHKHYESSVKEHAAIIGAIEQVVSELSKLKGGKQGQKKDAAWKAGIKKSFLEIVGDSDEDTNTFIQLATDADQAALEKLIALLNNILRNTKKSLSDDESVESQSISSFNKLKVGLQADIIALENLLKRQQTNLEHYLKKVNDLTLTINIRSSLLHSRQLELKTNDKERKDKEGQHNSDTARRNKEKEVIQRVQKIVKERLAAMSRFLKTNVNK